MRPERGLLCLLALAASQAFAEPVVIHRGTTAEPPTLDPNRGAGTLASPIIADMVVSLLAKDAASKPAPASAERWEISEDGLTYTFYLREGLKWSDGTPLTADDFVYSFRRLMSPELASPSVAVFYPVVNAREVNTGELSPDTLGIEALDPQTLVIRLNAPTPYFHDLLGNQQSVPVPRHVIEEHGNGWTRAGRMVSNGPYVLTERVPQAKIKLVKNPYFYDADQVAIDEVYWYPTQDLGTSLKRFRAGELDSILNFPPDQLEWIRENMPETLHVVPSLAGYFINLNTRREPFDDPRVRRALWLAVDRKGITDKLLKTGVKPARGFVPANFTGYTGVELPDLDRPMAERQAEARELLRQAGFGPENPLTVPLVYDTQEENRKIFVAVAAMWQAIGVRTELENTEFRSLNRMIRTRDYTAARWAYFAPFDDAYSFLVLFLSVNPNNWPQYENAEFDDILERSNYERDSEKRVKLLKEAEQILMRDVPVIPIYYYAGRRLVAENVEGWIDSPRGPTPSRYLNIRAD